MRPKDNGGWGLKDMHIFARALIMKSMWRGLNSCGIWSEILKYKYLNNNNMEDLHVTGRQQSKGGSIIWNGFSNCWLSFTTFLKSHFGRGSKILIRWDGMNGISDNNNLSMDIINFLNTRGIFLLTQIIKDTVNGRPIWMTPEDLSLPEHLRSDWDNFKGL